MSGIGNINYANGVGYTELTGLGLTAATQETVQLDVTVSNDMSQNILNALRQFREEGNFNPTVAQMETRITAVGGINQRNQIAELNNLLPGFRTLLAESISRSGHSASDNTNMQPGFATSLGNYAGVNRLFSGHQGMNGQQLLARVHALLPNLNLSAGYVGTGDAPASWTSGGNHVSFGYANGSGPTPNTVLVSAPGGIPMYTNAQMQMIISALETQIATLTSSSPIAAASANGLSTQDWLMQEMGVQTLRDSYSLQQWGEIAQKLEVNAAKKASQLSLGQGGGIYQVNGQYFANGVEMSLSQINFCVRANQYQLIDQQIADQMNAIQKNNERAKMANDLLAALKKAGQNTNLANEQTGTEAASDFFGHSSSGLLAQLDDDNDFMALLKAAAPTFYSSFVRDTNGGTPFSYTGTVTYSDYDAALTAVNTFLSQNSTDNQVAQQRLETLNNTRQAVLTGMTSFTQSESQVVNRIGGNL